MEQYVIKGGVPLNGEVSIGGAKNAALGILAAAIMTDETVTIENVPNVRDTRVLLQAIEGIGAKVKYVYNNTVQINGGSICDINVDYEYIKKIRASYYLLGALLGKYKRSQVALPGGCNIGSRPIDQHIKGFKALGAEVEIEHAESRDELLTGQPEHEHDQPWPGRRDDHRHRQSDVRDHHGHPTDQCDTLRRHSPEHGHNGVSIIHRQRATEPVWRDDGAQYGKNNQRPTQRMGATALDISQRQIGLGYGSLGVPGNLDGLYFAAYDFRRLVRFLLVGFLLHAPPRRLPAYCHVLPCRLLRCLS